MTLDTMMAGGVTLGGVQIYNDIQHPHLRMAPGNTRSTGNTTGAAATLPYSLHGLYRACWHYKQCQQDNSIVIIIQCATHILALSLLFDSCMDSIADTTNKSTYRVHTILCEHFKNNWIYIQSKNLKTLNILLFQSIHSPLKLNQQTIFHLNSL